MGHNSATHRIRSGQDSSKQPMDEEMATLHGKELGWNQHVVKGRSRDTQTPGGKVNHTSRPHAAAGSSDGIQPDRRSQTGVLKEEDEWYQYACLIKE